MKNLTALRARLRRTLLGAAWRRFLAWLSCAVIFVSAGMTAAAAFRLGPAALAGLALAVLSALPVFLLWPPPAKLLERSLRRLDSDSVFEAYLEAPPGAARELLRIRAERLSAALPALPVPRDPLPRRLSALMIAAALTFAVAEAGSRILRKRPLLSAAAGDEAPAERSEKGSFSSPGEDRFIPDERRADEESDGAEGSGGFESGSGDDGRADDVGEMIDQIRRRGGKEDEFALPEGDEEGAAVAARDSGGIRGEVQEGEGAPLASAEEGEGAGREQGSRAPESRGKGYESSGATGVPSPIVDYRARFFEAFAKRMGKRAAASGELELGELAELERRYFRSFSLAIEAKTGEDPYEALLKRRWRDSRKGLE